MYSIITMPENYLNILTDPALCRRIAVRALR